MKIQLLTSFFVGLLILAACKSAANFSSLGPEVGALAPDFTLKNLRGENVSLSSLRGQVVMINFWATWCLPCREEMPAIQSLYDRGGFAVMAVDFGESPEKVQAFLEELGVDLPVLLDSDGTVQELYHVRGYPTSFFLDSQGVVHFLHIGQLSEADIHSYLSQLGVQP